MRIHHLDHNATTPADPRVLERFVAVERECPANPGSLHAAGRKARAAVEDARARIAGALGCAVDDVFFTSGGTESNNLAVRGLGDSSLPVLCAELEHPSVLVPAQHRGRRNLAVDPEGRAVVQRPDQPVGLLALVHGQNEVGTLQDVAAAAQLAQELGVPLHVDAAQTLGRVPLAPVVGAATTVSLSPHKCGGLRGIGILLARGGGAGLRPLLLGGGQEHGLRPGTQGAALCQGAALSVELAVEEQLVRAEAMAAARAAFVAALAATEARHRVLTPAASLPNTLMVQFPGLDGRTLLPALDLAGIQASQGSACSSGSPTPPRVLTAMGLDADTARSCVRFSFAPRHEIMDAREAGTTTGRVVARLQRKP